MKASAPQIEVTPDVAWGAFDRVYCISLKDRTDRREAAKREFARVGLLDRVEFVIVDRHPTDSEQGIFESHMSCVRAGLAAGAQRILIFEDDVVFRRFSPTVLARAVDFMKSNGDWGLFSLGCFVNSSKKTSFRSVLRMRYRCCGL
jgi:GR25 family glycosyltransferase involved in LPS biosynthesis